MASIAIMVGGAVLNAAAFIGGNALASAFGGGGKASLEEKIRHDKALEAYQAAYNKYMRDRTKLLDWIAIERSIKGAGQAGQHQHRLRLQTLQQDASRRTHDASQRAKVL